MNTATNTTAFLLVPRSYPNGAGIRRFSDAADAARCAAAEKEPCDVHAPSGAIVWAWEQRP